MNITLNKVKYILKVLFYFYTLFHCYHQVNGGEHHPSEQRKWWQVNNNNHNNGDSKSIAIKRHSSHLNSNHQIPKFNNSKYIEYFFNKQITTINPIAKKYNLAFSSPFIGTITTTTTTKPSFTKYSIRSSQNNNNNNHHHNHHRIRHNNYLNSHLNRKNNYEFTGITTTTTPEPSPEPTPTPTPPTTTMTTTTTTQSTTNWNDFLKNNLKSIMKKSTNNNYKQPKYNNRNSLINNRKNSTQLLLFGNRQSITTINKKSTGNRNQKKPQPQPQPQPRHRRPIKYRNPYDILQIPYKDRIIYPIINRKSTNTPFNYYDYSNIYGDDDDDDLDDLDDYDDDDGENSNDNEDQIDDLEHDDQDYYNVDKIFGKSKLLLKSNENNRRKVNAKNNYDGDHHMTNFMRQLKSKDKINNHNNNNRGDEETDYSKSYIPPGTLTNYKFQTLGTHSAVKKSRQSYMMTSSHQQKQALASAHASKIYAEASCKWPKPKIISVQNNPSKTYLPHCTILHRCGDDTGCCNTDTRTCVERYSQSIDLYFYVSTLGSKQGAIEKQTFVNHTECHCVDKILYLQSLTSSKHKSGSDNEQYNLGMEAMTTTSSSTADKQIACKCPKEFENVLQDDMLCRCDCSTSISNNGCDWMKKGKEHFSMADRKCIMEERCKMPTCEYGSYDKRHGKCPKKEDKLALGFSFNLN